MVRHDVFRSEPVVRTCALHEAAQGLLALLVGLLGLLSIMFASCWAAIIVILCALVMPLVMVCSVRYIKGFARAVWLTNICPFGCDYR